MTSRTVLIADDNRMDRMVLTKILRKEGYEVLAAVDGVEALELYATCEPEIVLLDALMPRMDGVEVARSIKEQCGDQFVPIVFLTSLTDAGELARCLDAGGDDFLNKPYNQVILKAKLSALERMRQLNVTVIEQRDQIAQHNNHLMHEQEAAKAVFDSVAHTGCLSAANIRSHISPLAVFNGDVLLAARSPSGNMHVLIGDFTGHGLTAAIGAMPLAEIFYGMTQKGFQVGEILREINHKLKQILPPGYFCCAAMFEFNFHKRVLEFWNGGLPPPFLYRHETGDVEIIPSTHLPLGVVDGSRFSERTQITDMAAGDRLFLWTDGILESRSQTGEMFGEDRLRSVFSDSVGSQGLFDRIIDAVNSHVGEQELDDDITIAAITMVEEHEVSARVATFEANGQVGPEDWHLAFELGPTSLRVFNPLPLLQHILMEVPQLRPQGGKLFTVLSELYSNGLEHGVLGLDSTLKRSAEGFSEYYEKRAEALATTQGFVRFEFDCRTTATLGELSIRVIDSGDGFDYEARTQSPDNDNVGYHGRGLSLLSSLCRSIEYQGRGNEVLVKMDWLLAAPEESDDASDSAVVH